MRYSDISNYTIRVMVAELMDSEPQDVTSLSLLAGFSEVDEATGADDVTFVNQTWHTDSTVTPPIYTALIEFGPAHTLQPARGRRMLYLKIDGEIYEAGVVEIY